MEMISIKFNTPGLLGSLAFTAVAILTFVIIRDRCTGNLNLYYWNIKYTKYVIHLRILIHCQLL